MLLKLALHFYKLAGSGVDDAVTPPDLLRKFLVRICCRLGVCLHAALPEVHLELLGLFNDIPLRCSALASAEHLLWVRRGLGHFIAIHVVKGELHGIIFGLSSVLRSLQSFHCIETKEPDHFVRVVVPGSILVYCNRVSVYGTSSSFFRKGLEFCSWELLWVDDLCGCGYFVIRHFVVLRCFHGKAFVPLLLHGRLFAGLLHGRILVGLIFDHGLACEALLVTVLFALFVVSRTHSFVSVRLGNAFVPGSDSFVKSQIVCVCETILRELKPAELFLEDCRDSVNVGLPQ